MTTLTDENLLLVAATMNSLHNESVSDRYINKATKHETSIAENIGVHLQDSVQ